MQGYVFEWTSYDKIEIEITIEMFLHFGYEYSISRAGNRISYLSIYLII